jgi:hypothetical protein
MSANALPNVPASGISRINNGYQPTVLCIGTNTFWPDQPVNNAFYWFVVVDLTNLKVVQSVTSTSSMDVPSQVAQYLGNPQYFLYFFGNVQQGFNIPTGNLASFLQKVGSSGQLAALEQMIEQFGTSIIMNFSYMLAATMTDTDQPGFESSSLFNSSVMTMAFMPVTVNGQTIYAPIQTSSVAAA